MIHKQLLIKNLFLGGGYEYLYKVQLSVHSVIAQPGNRFLQNCTFFLNHNTICIPVNPISTRSYRNSSSLESQNKKTRQKLGNWKELEAVMGERKRETRDTPTIKTGVET